MLKVLNCIVHEHDLRLVAISAVICALGSFTTTSLLARAAESVDPRRWLVCAAVMFGSSVWSLHFVAMIAFMPGVEMAYDIGLTLASVIVAVSGTLAAFLVLKGSFTAIVRVGIGGIILGLAITGMHYLGVAAMEFSGFLLFDHAMVAASVAASVILSSVAFARAHTLRSMRRRLEVAGWLAVAVCSLHFIGMTAISIAPGDVADAHGVVLGTSTLAFVVGAVSVAILVACLAATMVDQHLTQRALQDLSRMRLLSNLAQEVLFIHRDGVVIEINSAGERLFKASGEDLIGRPVLDLFSTVSASGLGRREQCPALGRPPEEFVAKAVDGTHVAVELSCQPIDYLGKPATAVALHDLTARKRDEARILHLARHDALTNLPNRYSLQERLEIALGSAAQQRNSLAVVYFDLDRFKPVNDLYGHAAGDALLIQVAKRILGEIHPQDTLARVGGDEFVMVLTKDVQADKVMAVTARVIEALERPFDVEGHRVEIDASAGIALYPEDGGTADELMRAADAAMYRAKEEQRGSLRFYEPAMNAQHQARLQMRQELSGAIDRGELTLHYQPIVNGATGEVENFEALIRWNHPERGLVPPLQFIPLAETTGLIDQIGRWVIETACREAASWPRPWRVSVNVSPAQFRQTNIPEIVGRALRANGLDPARLVIEVTEGVLIADADMAVAVLNQLKDMGVRVALDDFGTGYSSLSYLQMFKFDKFKIDKSFVQRLGESDEALTIIRTIMNLGHNLGLQVTAEGVETAAQLKVLRSLGCDQIQGYLIARPAPINDFNLGKQLRTVAMFGQDNRRSA